MTNRSIASRRLSVALLLAACVASGGHDLLRCSSLTTWSRLASTVEPNAAGLSLDIDLDGDLDRISVDRTLATRTVWESAAPNSLPLLQLVDLLSVSDAALHDILRSLNSDDSDPNDSSARGETRAAPIGVHRSSSLLASTPVSPHSRPYSSSTPRAPPAVPRFA